MNVIITKKTKLGFGYNGKLLLKDGYIRPPKSPSITGTIKKLRKKIKNDADYQKFIKKNPYHVTSWFVCVNGKWRFIDCECIGWKLLWYDNVLCDKHCNFTEVSVKLCD